MLNYAQGALLGAFVGDAAGATLEFLGRIPSSKDVDEALSMQGGGVFHLAPGQITDDSELAICLARGLVSFADDDYRPMLRNQRFDPENVAIEYRKWYQSRPFDAGHATSQAFGFHEKEDTPIHQQMTNAALKANMGSKANGALMRCVPLAIWGTKTLPQTLATAAREDTRLSHPNPSCQHSTAAYVLAIRSLIINPGDVEGALACAKQYLVSEAEAAEVLEWFNEALADEPYPYYPQSGYVRIAFTHAFRHLAKQTPFEDALRETLLGGGDTDTNACIVGGMMGALHGVNAIPAKMRNTVLRCNTQQGRPRPDWLSAHRVLDFAYALLSRDQNYFDSAVEDVPFPSHTRLCFYPSCWNQTPWILMGLDCDLYIMSDKVSRATKWSDFEKNFKKNGIPLELIKDSPRYMICQSGSKLIYVFREDNRVTLKRIANQNLRIHHFVGICDGCSEGGNYECVHEKPFLSYLLPLAADEMVYTTDHSSPLQPFFNRKFIERMNWKDFPSANREHLNALVNETSKELDAEFILQAVLVEDEQKKLYVLPFSDQNSRLSVFKPFRSKYGRRIIAEYHVTFES